MKTILLPITALFFYLTQISQAGDSAYRLMIMEASVKNSDAVTLAIDSPEEPGDIEFGIMHNQLFVGQRFSFRPLDSNTRRVEVTLEDIEAPVAEKPSGLTTQVIHKKRIVMKADGKSYRVEVNKKEFTFKIYAIGGVSETKRIFVPNNPE